MLSVTPLGPAVRHHDDALCDIAKWSIHAQIDAEGKGVTSANADQMPIR